MKNFSPKNRIYLAGIIAITATIVFTMGFLSLKASACESLCQPDETLTEFNYNSKPQSAFIDENTQNVTNQLCECSYLSVDTSDGSTHYIYLTWNNLGDISDYGNIVSFDLLLNHKEADSTIKVELKNELDNWVEVCDPVERSNFTTDTCNLSSYFDTLKQVSPIELRVVVQKTGTCHEYLKCAKLNVKLYNCEKPECTQNSDCDDGLLCNGQETCVDEKCVPGTAVNCSGNNISAIGTCVNDPDNNPFTWDFRALFTSVCQEPSGTCTTGIETITHACDKDCGGCEADVDCDDQDEHTTDNCNLTSCQCEHTTNPYCGDQICSGEETCSTCPGDCGQCPPPGCQSNVDCDDQNACTTDVCDTGTGTCMHAGVTCFDENPCTNDSCNPASGCVFTPNQQCVCDPQIELVQNGGFENPEVTTPQLWDIFVSSLLGGWTTQWMSLSPSEWNGFPRPADAALELQRGVNGWDPKEGSQHAELDTDWDGPAGSLTNEPASVKIYQDLSTIPGETYNISFWFSPRPNTGLENNRLQFNWNGEVKDTISAAGETTTVWVEHSYSFTATNNTTRIEFADLGVPSDSLGTFLDNVSVRCNPLVQGCGNNVIEQGETCELPDTTNNQNCSQSTAQCATGNKTQTRDAFGNCDGACGCISDNFSEPVCVKDSCNAVCAVDADCNDQNENTTDTCNLTTCSCQNISHTCGNGILQEGEQCDNGTQNGQACSPACENSCSYCSAQCTIVALQGETCGRGGDGGGGGGGGHLIVCGDGIREWEEQCDDGNKIDGDGCSSICRTEQVLGETTEEEGEILAESTTRLPETGGNPLWISVVGLIAAFASGISIKKLAFSRI